MKLRFATVALLAASFYILGSTIFYGQLTEIGLVKVRQLLPQPAFAVSPTPAAAAPLPVTGGAPLPALTSSHWEILDLGSGKVLSSANPQVPVAMASLTKLMTAYVVRQKDSLTQPVTIQPEDVAISSDDSRMGLVAGERITVGDLLKGLLIPSGDDAALALARYTSGSEEAFVSEMNRQASLLHLARTHFSNAAGLDEANHFSSPSDLAQLARLTMTDPALRQIVGTRQTTLTALSGQVHTLYNTNTLLDRDGVVGIKTGHTDNAGDCLISLESIDGHEIIIALLGSSDRFGETEALINWVRENTKW